MLLNQAHRLMSTGRYIDAGAIFERLARGAVQRGIPRAPFLFVQAGKAYLEGGEKPKGFTLVKHGLKLLAEAGRVGCELYRLGHRTLAVLDEKGFTDEKEQLAAWLEEVLPEDSEQGNGSEIADHCQTSRPSNGLPKLRRSCGPLDCVLAG